MPSPINGNEREWPPVHILMYHDIETVPRAPKYNHFYVLASELRRQMRGLLAAGYHPVRLREVLAAQRGEGTLPDKPFVVTFDDGYRNVLRHGHALLREMAIPYTVFLVSDRIGKTNDWVASDGYETSPLLTWSEIEQMRADWDSGVDFQPHTATHRRLADIAIGEASEELRRCKIALEDRLGSSIDVICYPYGSVNSAVAQAARDAGYTAGLTTEFGRVRASDDPMRLPRIGIHHVPPVSLKFGLRQPNFWWRIKTRKDNRE